MKDDPSVPWPLHSLVCLFLMIFVSIPPYSVISHFTLKSKSLLKSLLQIFCLYTNYLLSLRIPCLRAYTTKILRLHKNIDCSLLSIILVTTLKCPGLSYLQLILLCKILTIHVTWVQIFLCGSLNTAWKNNYYLPLRLLSTFYNSTSPL